MLRIKTKGTAFERGRQQGEQTRELFVPWATGVLDGMAQRLQASSPTDVASHLAGEIAGRRSWLEELYPEAAEECRGLAAGLEMDETTYFAVVFGEPLLAETKQCTTLGFLDARGHPVLGKTDDIFQHELGMNLLETTLPDEGYRHAHFHFAGSVWTVAGMNEHGLAMAMTGIPGPTLPRGLPSLVVLHLVLPSCASVDEAVALLRDVPVSHYGFSLLLGDAGGTLALVEKTGAGMVRLPEQPGGFFLHTNHILDAEFAGKNPQQREPFLQNGQRRFQNALTRARSLPRTQEGMREFLADRSPRGAICQQGEHGLHTDFAVTLLPSEKNIIFWPGYPGRVPSEKLELSTVFS